MILKLRKILSINERFAFSLIGKIRLYILIPFNLFLKYQENLIKKRLSTKISFLRQRLLDTLPKVSGDNLYEILTSEECKQIVSDADKVVEHQFEIFSKKIEFNNGIDWHLDFNSGARWPKGKLYSKYNQVDVSNEADVKFPRELSRCHHFLCLGQAYLLSGNDKYTKEFIDEVNSWISENPYKKSINWGCSMDIAIRASNWIYALKMFENSTLVNDEFIHEISTSLYLHGRFIYEHPEKNRVYNHNHYLSDLAGQILIGVFFEGSKIDETQLWKENGIYELFREIRLQILPTGFTYERTTNYHRLVTELISYTIILLKNNHIEIPYDINLRLKKMFEVVLNYNFTDGQAPVIGDQDNGRFLPFFRYNINYQKYLLNIGAVLFNDGIFKHYSGKNIVDVLFLFGKKGCLDFKKINTVAIQLKSKSFSDAGFYIMRSKNVYVFINNSGLSHYNEVDGGTHTHSDLLSFVYSFNDIPFLIDPGTYVYSSNPKERMKFRSTAMHNTITVDDYNQNTLNESDLWSIKRDAVPNEIIWECNEKKDIYEGSHNGYERLEDPVSHYRRFELDKTNETLTIFDKILSKGNHTIKSHLHFDNNVDVIVTDNVIYCRSQTEAIKIMFEINSSYSIELKEEFISKSYGKKIVAPYIEVSLVIENAENFKTIIRKSQLDETDFTN